MEGDITSPENMGVIPRSVHAIFDYLDGISADYTVRTSFLELYNEVGWAAEREGAGRCLGVWVRFASFGGGRKGSGAGEEKGYPA